MVDINCAVTKPSLCQTDICDTITTALVAATPAPTFVTLSNSIITAKPTVVSDVGVHLFNVTRKGTDGYEIDSS